MVSQFALVVALAQAPADAATLPPTQPADYVHREIRVTGSGKVTAHDVSARGVCVEFVNCANALAQAESQAAEEVEPGSETPAQDEPEILFLTSAQIAALEAARLEAEASEAAAAQQAAASGDDVAAGGIAASENAAGDTALASAQDGDEIGADGESNDIVVTGALEAPAGDPAEAINAATFDVIQDVDKAIVEPIANVYEEALPKPARAGLRNFLSNLGEPVNALNFLLQLKPGKALKSVGRFAVNTTVGIGGLFDPAEKKLGMKHESNGFANTMGYYGIGPGPYLYLPFIGSTTVRDLGGRLLDLSFLPTAVGKPFNDPLYTVPVGALISLESRIEVDDQIDAIREQCGDAYSATRDIYLVQRQLEIDALRGKESSKVAELVDRLEFNCDIEVLTSASPGQDAGEFVKQSTTLLKKDSETADEVSDGEASEAEPQAQIDEAAAASPVAGDMVPIEPSDDSAVDVAAEPANEAVPEEASPMAY